MENNVVKLGEFKINIQLFAGEADPNGGNTDPNEGGNIFDNLDPNGGTDPNGGVDPNAGTDPKVDEGGEPNPNNGSEDPENEINYDFLESEDFKEYSELGGEQLIELVKEAKELGISSEHLEFMLKKDMESTKLINEQMSRLINQVNPDRKELFNQLTAETKATLKDGTLLNFLSRTTAMDSKTLNEIFTTPSQFEALAKIMKGNSNINAGAGSNANKFEQSPYTQKDLMADFAKHRELTKAGKTTEASRLAEQIKMNRRERGDSNTFMK